MRVLKKSLPTWTQTVSIEIQQGALIRKVGFTPWDRQICIWFEADLQNWLEERKFVIVPTGFEEVPKGGRYLDTIIEGASQTVWHIYEVDLQD